MLWLAFNFPLFPFVASASLKAAFNSSSCKSGGKRLILKYSDNKYNTGDSIPIRRALLSIAKTSLFRVNPTNSSLKANRLLSGPGASCPAGSAIYQTGASPTGCIPCPPGTYSAPDHRSCPLCSPGFYSAGNAANCTPCSAGSYTNVPGSHVCAQCLAGSRSSAGQNQCELCPPGQYSNGGEAECTVCGIGTFAKEFGSSVCLRCSEGFYSGTEGSSECSACPAGTFSGSGAVECTDCSIGTANPLEGRGSCPECEPGTYSSEGRQEHCTNCSAGTYNPEYGSVAESACSKCEEGKVSGPGSGSCMVCGAGTYSSPEKDRCIECPEGTYNSKEQQNSVLSCLPCPKMHYNNETGKTECPHCPSNAYTNKEGSTRCDRCNRLCAECYGESNNDCTECKAGVVMLEELKGTRCACVSGYFDDPFQVEIPHYCQPCHEFCRDCYYTRDNCVSCIYNKGVRMVDNKCQCTNSGYFISSDAITQRQECVRCYPLCSSCYGSRYNQCLVCSEEAHSLLVAPNTCGCPSNYYYNSTLEKCDPCNGLCGSCHGPTNKECDTCIEQVSLSIADEPSWCASDCELLGSYYRDGQHCKRKLLPTLGCHGDCATCKGPTSGDCYTCALDGKVMHEYKCVARCPDRHTPVEGVCYGNLISEFRMPLHLQ